MSRNQRNGLLAVTAAILIVSFLIARPSSDDDKTSTTTTAATTAATTVTTPTGTTVAQAPAQAKPAVDLGPLLTKGSVKTISVRKGEQVRFRVRSSVAEEVHVHGYDLMRDIKPGETLKLSFKATIEGIFEIEFEDSATQIAKLRVEP